MPRRVMYRDEENPFDLAGGVPSVPKTEYRDEVKPAEQVVIEQTDKIISNFDEDSRRLNTAGTGTICVGSATNVAGITSVLTPTDIAIWAGAPQQNMASAPFRVDASGNASIAGITIGTADVNSGLNITIADTVNKVGITVNQNDVTNNPNTINIVNAGTGYGLFIDQNGNGQPIYIDTEQTTGKGIYVLADTLTTGVGLEVRTACATFANTSSGLADFISTNAGSTGNIMRIYNAGTGRGIFVDQNGNQTGIYIDSESTTTDGMGIQSDALTSGSIIRLASNSADTTARSLVEIVNDNTAATGAYPLLLQQDAVISTNFKKISVMGGVTIWTSDGTTPNGNLSGTAGDICLGADNGRIYKCNGTTDWSDYVEFHAGVLGATDIKNYHIFPYPCYISTLWTASGCALVTGIGCVEGNVSTDITNYVITNTNLLIPLYFSTTKNVIAEFGIVLEGILSEQRGFGLTSSGVSLYDYDDQTVDSASFTLDTAGNLYAHTSNAGVGHTESAAITGITLTNLNTFRIEFDPGVDAKFYINGVLKATITTNLPDGNNTIYLGCGASGATGGVDYWIYNPWFAIEK